jgi:hypothetical protein
MGTLDRCKPASHTLIAGHCSTQADIAKSAKQAANSRETLAGHHWKSGRPPSGTCRPADQQILWRQTILRYVGHALLEEALGNEHFRLALLRAVE